MKTKLYKILGVALTLVLLASLTAGLATVPAGAATSNLKFTKLSLPIVEDWSDHDEFVESEGDFWATPGVDLGPIAQTPDGEILFAAVADYPYSAWPTWCDMLKSTDGGYSWVPTGFWDEWDDAGDTSAIVDIVASPDYNEDTTVIVATRYFVYQSVDGGKNFVNMEDSPPWVNIRDLDVALDDRGRLAYMIAGRRGNFSILPTSDVFVFSTDTGLQWQPQLIDYDDDGDGVYDVGDGDIDYDVLACAFSPFFADDGGIMAVVTDGTLTRMRFSIGNIQDGGGWGTDIMDATFVTANLVPFESRFACIGLPDDFDFFGIGNNICFVGLYSEAGYQDLANEEGDVYKMLLKEAGTSKAVDLDIRGILTTLAPTATDIVSIDVCGPAEAANILVGIEDCNLGTAPEHFLVYHSEDSGDSWAPAAKPPTGGDKVSPAFFDEAKTRVLMAPDFCDSGIAYASTRGDTSALSRTTDGANSWNQISLIDFADGGYMVPAFTGLSAAGYNAAGTLRIVMQGTEGAVFETNNAGKNWERIFSYANPGVTNGIDQVKVFDDNTMFAVDKSDPAAGYIWRSSDAGATWPKKITTKPDLTTASFVSPTTLYTGHDDGGIFWSTKSGVGWTKPDDSEVPDTPIKVLIVMGDIILVSTGDGMGFVSSDGGETVERIGVNNPGDAGADGDAALVTPDFNFANNNLIYCAVIIGGEDNIADAPDGGIWRTELNLADPASTLWERIDDIQPPAPYNYANVTAGSPVLCLPPSGVAYVFNQETVVTEDADEDGGIWRSTNASSDVDGVVPPYWEKENKGLNAGDGLALLDVDVFPTTLFAWNPNAVMGTGDYWEQVVMFTDTLDSGVTLAMPTADETGVGLLPEGYVYPEVTIAWEEMAGATSYQYQMAIDPNFKTMIPPGCGFTTSLAVGSIELNPNTTYYWRVRVAADGSLIGAPLISPWSETWKFKTAIGASMARPDLQAPWPGEPDVPLSPTFEWSGIEWAEVYEYELAIDPATTAGGYFTEPLVALVGTNSLVSTAWKCDMTLDYNTRYYWHVKAIGVDTDTPWSDVGTFTTMGVPPEPPEAQPPVVIPPAEKITPAWIWAIVIIGAILVIAVIVLIVTTRRVP
jgi:hypothetical protein